MKPESKYDPVSINERVRDRIEKKANGSGSPVPPSATARAQASQSHFSSSKNADSLKDEFMDLLFTSTPSNTSGNTAQAPTKKSGISDENLKTKGTKELFSPLNKGEVKERKADESKGPFSFSINNSALGELNIQGSYQNGNLMLNVEMPPKLSINEQKVLAKILEAKLSKELGVKLEVKIGRRNT